MMDMRLLIRFYGALDGLLIIWVVVSALRFGKIPFITDFIESTSASESFGLPYGHAIAALPFLLLLSVLISGPLLLWLKRFGVYLSLVQAPFRLLWVLQPTFFFFLAIKGDGYLYFAQIIIVVGLEILKVVTLIAWLRTQNREIFRTPQ
jgi:hypothetical protein